MPSDPMDCPSCGGSNLEEARSCDHCGSPISIRQSHQPPPQPVNNPQPQPQPPSPMTRVSNNAKTWAIIAIILVLVPVVVITTILFFPGLSDHNDRGLYVDRATIEYEPGLEGDSYVNVILWISNEGSSSQNIIGCQLKTALYYEGVLMDEEVGDLNGLLDPLNIYLYPVEFHAEIPLNFGEEARVIVTFVDSDGTVLDTGDYNYTMS